MDRSTALKNIRINLERIENNIDNTAIEQFQNHVLRPILKFQHEAIKHLFEAFLKQKGDSFTWSDGPFTKEKYEHLVYEKAFRDSGFTHSLNGLMMGLMTLEELVFFTNHMPECRRRVITMSKKRIISVFEEQ